MFIRRLFSVRRESQLWRRCSSTFYSLPPPDEWRTEFPFYKANSRVSVRNPSTADKLAEAFLSTHRGNTSDEGKVVIEAFPGPGSLTRSLLKLPSSKIKRLIVLEDFPAYLKYLEPLQESDPRLTVVPLSGFAWSTYSDIEARGLLDEVKAMPWDAGEPNLHFISHIPNSVLGDQVMTQFWRLIPARSWLFKYGRVPMSLILKEDLWKRAAAGVGEKQRCKLSVIAQGASIMKEVLDAKSLTPHSEHFHPSAHVLHIPNKRAGTPYTAIEVIPTKNSLIEGDLLDKWDYVLRRMFVLKRTQLSKSIGSLAPGATNLLRVLTDPNLPKNKRLDPRKEPRDLTPEEWALVVKAFDEWPFAPEDLSITDSFTFDIERD